MTSTLPHLSDADRELTADEYSVMPAAMDDEQVARREAHTPGPWVLDPPISAHVIDGDYHVIEAGDGRFASETRRGFHIATFISLSDAQFIAAAPDTAAERDRLKAVNAELLEALEAVYRDVSKGFMPTLHLSRMRSAIESATRAATGASHGS